MYTLPWHRFFDYDNDGDLDMYLTVNEANQLITPAHSGTGFITDGQRVAQAGCTATITTRLKHPVYTDVSKAAGILIEGYGHAATIADINRDGWKDIYVTNDFLPTISLYINNHDGTFTDRTKEYFKHTRYQLHGPGCNKI
jgi:hypothetical protein